MVKKLHHEEKLHMDIVSEIMLYLPVKTLSRLRCVSKSWNSLISLPSFQQNHYQRSLQSPLLLFAINDFDYFEGTNDLHLLRYSSNNINTLIEKSGITSNHNQRPSFFAVQSVGGLVYFVSRADSTLLICNPATTELMILPPPPAHGINHCTGFGLVESTREFKVVTFFSTFDPINTTIYSHCYIYNLSSSDGWRQANSPPFHTVVGQLPFLHGAIHLLPFVDPNNDLDVDHSYSIAAFNIESEEYKEISLPNCYNNINTATTIFLTELGGLLCLSFYRSGTKQLELWLLKDYHNGVWGKVYNIDVYSTNPVDFAWPLLICGDGSIFVSVVTGDQNEIRVYNSGNKSTMRWRERDCTAALYVESFASIRSRP